MKNEKDLDTDKKNKEGNEEPDTADIQTKPGPNEDEDDAKVNKVDNQIVDVQGEGSEDAAQQPI